MKIHDLFPLADLGVEVVQGYVSAREHPEFPELRILNYTPKAAYEGRWNTVTQTCRGLIYNVDTEEVLARPFAKFFNYGQNSVIFDPDRPILGAYDKLDGSLGILYERPDGKRAIATRGSFDSLQARHATEKLQGSEMDQHWWGYTPLFEIIYPDNRIVLDYHGADFLGYLGKIKISTGEYTPPVDSYLYDDVRGYDPLRATKGLPVSTIAQALAYPPRDNAEGMVIWIDSLTPVKIKQDDYVALHRIVTGLNRKTIWEQMVSGDLWTWIEQLPDEFYQWAEGVAKEIEADVLALEHSAKVAFDLALQRSGITGPGPYTREQRGTFAHEAKKYQPLTSLLFALLDDRDIRPAILKSLEPKGALL